MATTFLLVVAASLSVVLGQSKFVIKSAPEYIQLDSEAGPIQSGDIANVLTSMMGFESSNTPFQWTGLKNGDVFKRPSATLSILLEQFTSELPVTSLASFSTDNAPLSNVLLGKSVTSVASAISENTESFSLSMSSNAQYAEDGAARDVSSGRDLTVSLDKEFGFRDSSDAFVIQNANAENVFAAGDLGENIIFNQAGNSFTVQVSGSAVTLDLNNPAVQAPLFEMYSMVAVLKQALAARANSPTVLTFAVASLANTHSLAETERAAFGVVVSAFIEKLHEMANAAFQGNLVTTIVSSSAPASAVHHHVSGRSLSSDSTPYVPNRNSRDFVAFCQSYTCFCNLDSNGKPYGTDNNPCQTNCQKGSFCDCAYYPCDCASGRAQMGAAVCSACQTGFSLQGGQCYVESNFPGMFQIWFWGGLAIVLALISTCYAIGGMDPGRNGVIYRMTSQRTKSS